MITTMIGWILVAGCAPDAEVCDEYVVTGSVYGELADCEAEGRQLPVLYGRCTEVWRPEKDNGEVKGE